MLVFLHLIQSSCGGKEPGRHADSHPRAFTFFGHSRLLAVHSSSSGEHGSQDGETSSDIRRATRRPRIHNVSSTHKSELCGTALFNSRGGASSFSLSASTKTGEAQARDIVRNPPSRLSAVRGRWFCTGCCLRRRPAKPFPDAPPNATYLLRRLRLPWTSPARCETCPARDTRGRPVAALQQRERGEEVGSCPSPVLKSITGVIVGTKTKMAAEDRPGDHPVRTAGRLGPACIIDRGQMPKMPVTAE